MKPYGYLLSTFFYVALMCPLFAVAMMRADDPQPNDAPLLIHQHLFATNIHRIMFNPDIDVSVELKLLEQERLKKKGRHWKLNEFQKIAAQNLFRELKQHNITINQTLYRLLVTVNQDDFSSVCHKVGVFFRYVNPGVIKNSACLTNMLRIQKYLQDFIARDDESIKYIAGLDTLRAFSSMQSNKGIPVEQAVRDMLSWDVWQVEEKFDHTLFHAFSSMQCGKGLPAEQDVMDLLALDIWQVDEKFNTELFRAFASMYNGKGLPAEQDVMDLLALDIWQVDGEFSPEFFCAFSSMHRKGLTIEQNVRNLLDSDCHELSKRSG